MVPHLPYPRRAAPLAPAPAALQPSTPRLLSAGAPDLQTQFEAMLDAVWKAEADWRFNDRLDMAVNHRRHIAT